LKSHGISTFYDEADIAIGDFLAVSIERAVQHAKYLLVVMSPDYFSSAWATKELELALNLEFENGQMKVLPILYRDCEIPPLLHSKVYADFRTDDAFNRSFPMLLEVLSKPPESIEWRSEKAHTETPALGSIPQAQLESVELRRMIEELKVEVQAFTTKVQSPPVQAPQSASPIDPKLCFIMMPFGSNDLNDVYEYFLKPAIEAHCHLLCERGDDVFGSNVIMDDIRRSIEKARVVVADLTGRNPNVFYEVGIAHTLNKDVLLLSQSMSDVPFDLRHRRVLVYDYTPKGCKRLEKSIVDNVNSILQKGA
jgi:hypothetical protein